MTRIFCLQFFNDAIFFHSGCTNHPAPGERFCSYHTNHTSPALTPNQLSKASLSELNQQHTSREKFLSSGLERDNIFVVQGSSFSPFLLIIIVLGILDEKGKNGEILYQVKWENYEKPTWEPKKNIPDFLTNHFEKMDPMFFFCKF